MKYGINKLHLTFAESLNYNTNKSNVFMLRKKERKALKALNLGAKKALTCHLL